MKIQTASKVFSEKTSLLISNPTIKDPKFKE